MKRHVNQRYEEGKLNANRLKFPPFSFWTQRGGAVRPFPMAELPLKELDRAA